MPGLIVSDNISWRLVASNAPQLVSGYSCDSLSVDGELWGGMSGAPRQWLSMIALVSPADCCVIRKELVQYDSGCDFTRVPSSESPKFFFPADMLFQCSGCVFLFHVVQRQCSAPRQWLPVIAYASWSAGGL